MKKIIVVANAHFYKTTDGKYFTNNIYDNNFLKRYFYGFEHVSFCAKTKLIEHFDVKNLEEVKLDNLRIIELPWYRGIFGLVKNLYKLVLKLRNEINDGSHLLLRMTQIESILAYYCWNKKSALAVEVINDPKGYYKNFFAFFSSLLAAKIIKKSDAASYVSQNYLQLKYPTDNQKKNKETSLSVSYQSIDLYKEHIYSPKIYKKPIKNLKFVHVSNNIVGMKKGYKTIFLIIKTLKDKKISSHCNFVGSGKSIPKLEKLAKKMQILDSVTFVGRINIKKDLILYMRKHDIFLFPSQSEGIGRVNLEAMAAGVPVLTSKSGGIAEIIDDKYLFEYGDYIGFANMIEYLINNPNELTKISKENHIKVKQYEFEEQKIIRNFFFNKFSDLKR